MQGDELFWPMVELNQIYSGHKFLQIWSERNSGSRFSVKAFEK